MQTNNMLTIVLELFAKYYGKMEMEDIKFSLVNQDECQLLGTSGTEGFPGRKNSMHQGEKKMVHSDDCMSLSMAEVRS